MSHGYYTVSGNFSIDGAAQSGATVVLYKVDGDNAAGSPVTASLTADSLLNGMTEWPDNPPSAWYYLAMQEATNGHDCEMVNNVEVWTALK